MSAVHVEYIYTREEAERARRASLKAASPFLRYLPYIVPFAVVVGVATILSSSDIWFVWPVVAVALVFAFWRAHAKNRKLREEAFNKSPDANNPVRWTIDADHIELRGVSSETTMKWSGYIKARETDLGFLLYFQPRLAHWLPKSGFKSGSDIETMRNWIAEKGIPCKRA